MNCSYAAYRFASCMTPYPGRFTVRSPRGNVPDRSIVDIKDSLIKDSKTSGRRNLALSGCAEAEGGEPQSSPRPEFRLPGGTPVDAERTSAVGDEQQKPTGDRDVLEEHDHLRLISEVVMEGECSKE